MPTPRDDELAAREAEATPHVAGRRPGRRLLAKQTDRFLREPPSVRRAAGVIVTVTAIVVVVSGLLMRIFDPAEFPNIGLSLWWSLQTATTVGYGDVTPTTAAGRIVAAVVMLEGIAFIAIVTAAITSTFVARAQRLTGVVDDADRRAVEKQLEELVARFDRLEQALRSDHPPGETKVHGNRVN